MTAASGRLARADFVRAPLLASARPDGYQEWYHFIVHHARARLLVNLSLADEAVGGGHRLVPRVIVLVHGTVWTGALERFGPEELSVSPRLTTLGIGGNRLAIGPDGYRLRIELPGSEVRGELHLTPSTPRLALVTNRPAGAGRMSWVCVPLLRAAGWLRAGGVEHRLDDAVAYHDHNWGRFRWGDDFGWEWASVLPSGPDRTWSAVFLRMTDRARLHTRTQALYVWRDGHRPVLFRDAALRVRSDGLLGRAPDCTLPPAMALVLGGDAVDVPESLTVVATAGRDRAELTFSPGAPARLVRPSASRPDRSVTLCETSGPARLRGRLGGQDVDVGGVGVGEWCHG